MVRRVVAIGAVTLILVPGCGQPHAASGPPQRPQLFADMGDFHRTVTTSSADAQKFFDQGLIWTYGFNHDEAERSFAEAARLDPACAMAWWGVALCNGPHVNRPLMDEKQNKAAWTAIEKAAALKDRASPVERALIEALATRYASPPPADRRPLDEAYAKAMRGVWRQFPDDVDVGTLFAESMMDLSPWAYWKKDGQPNVGTDELLAALDAALRLNARHLGALHLYIHAVEASPYPERAADVADRLRGLVPMSSHLVHMPSHIDVRVGRWQKAVEQNVKAVEADRRYRSLSPQQDFYRIYKAHNQHFLAFASMMEGRSELARKSAHDMIAGIPERHAREQAVFFDPVMSIEIDVLMRFGRWDDILKAPEPAGHFPIARALWRFTRGVALAAKGDVSGAEREKRLFDEAAKKVPAEALMAINKAHDVLAIAERVLTGEIAFRRGATDEAVAALREAAQREDKLMYMEPPEWIQPARHTLGAVLVSAGRFEEAERVYRDDLKKWPENGWSLYGLSRCLQARGSAEAASVEQRFKQAWARADVPIGSSCLCVKGDERTAAR